MTQQDHHNPEHSPQHDVSIVLPHEKSELRHWVSGRLGVFLATTSLAVFGGAELDRTSTEAQAQTNVPAEVTPASVAARANGLVAATALSWAGHQRPNGQLIDPVKTINTYGAPMIGQSMIETGVASGNPTLVDAGIKAELNQIKNPDTAGFNTGFEVFSMADSYVWNNKNLAENPTWQTANADIANFLHELSDFEVGESKDNNVAKCFENTDCYYNLKLVKVLADIELKTAQITPKKASTAANNKANVSANTVLQQASKHTGKNARFMGENMSFEDAGILSDPPRNPLAYSAFSSMILGHIIERQGYQNASPSLKKMFDRSVRALVGFMSPDGDVSYIGRGQGQVWTAAATADALSIAAKNSTDPIWRGRFLAGASKAVTKLETDYRPGEWGMPLVPRLANVAKQDYNGIDRYANTVGYNGLAVYALRNAAKSLAATPATTPANLEGDGVFVDPSQTRFATVRKNGSWFAIKAAAKHIDSRYDFGVGAAEKQLPNGEWKPALPHRPYSKNLASGGPVIIEHGKRLVPKGTKITANKEGVVKVDGGWATQPNAKPSVDRGTRWTFRPRGTHGVSMSFRSPGKRDYQFQIWYKPGSKVTVGKKSVRVAEPNGRTETYSTNRTMRVTKGKTAHSAYDKTLSSSTITIKAKKPGNVEYNTSF